MSSEPRRSRMEEPVGTAEYAIANDRACRICGIDLGGDHTPKCSEIGGWSGVVRPWHVDPRSTHFHPGSSLDIRETAKEKLARLEEAGYGSQGGEAGEHMALLRAVVHADAQMEEVDVTRELERGEAERERLRAFALEHGAAALLDHLGLDGMGNDVTAGQKALIAARHAPSVRVGPPQPARVLRAAQRTESFPELSPGDYELLEGPWLEWGAARDVRWERYVETRYGAIGEIVMTPGHQFVTPLADYYAMAVGTKQGDRVNWLVCPRVKLDNLIAERAIPDDGTMTFLVMEEPKSDYEEPR